MKLLMIPVCLLVAACGFTPFGDTVRSAVKTYGAQAYDEGLVNSEFYICKAASVGSVIRRYGGEKSAAWRSLCKESGEGIIDNGPAGQTP